MRHIICLTTVIIGLLLINVSEGFSQQLKLGKNPSSVIKSAVLELESTNQGLLLTRLADTVGINLFAPPDGMLIYLTTAKQVFVRANGKWQAVAAGTVGMVTSVTSANGNATITNTTSTPVITIVSAPKLTTARTIQGVSFDGTANINLINGTGFVKASGTTLSYDNTTYLSSVDTSNIPNFYTKTRSLISAGTGISYNNATGVIINSAPDQTVALTAGTGIGITGTYPNFTITNNSPGAGGTVTSVTSANSNATITNTTTTPVITIVSAPKLTTARTIQGVSFDGTANINLINGTGFVKASGTTLSYDNTTYLSSVDTSNISNFYLKVRGLHAGTAPITYNNSTGIIGITQANSTTNGYLSSADWVTFNNKLSSNNVWTRQGNAGTNPGTDFIGTTDAQDLIFKTNGTERWRIENSSGDIKIGSATAGTFKATKELVMREDGDDYGSSILRLRNRVGENGAIFETTTTDPGATLVDFIFKTSVNQRNIRFESRPTYSLVGVPAFHIGGSNPDVPNLAIGDVYSAFNTKLKIGNYTTATEMLDVAGNVKFSGALMPNNTAGTSGQLLQSNGAGNAPTWVNSPSSAVTNDDYVYAYATTTKTFTSAGNFADITINGANGQLSGWAHSISSNTQNFTCNQTGVYQVSYRGQVTNTSSTVRELAIRAVLDGTEIAGSANSIECSSASNTSLNNTFLVSITSGQVLKLQMTGSNTSMQLVAAGNYGTTKPSISITIVRIK